MTIFSIWLCSCGSARLEVTPKSEYKTVSLRIKSYCPSSGFTLREFFAQNKSGLNEKGTWAADWDRDMLTDSFETNTSNISYFNLDYKNQDTNLDGYTDVIMVRMNRQASNQVFSTCLDPASDVDNDGLSDCDENLLQTSSTNPDSDSDGIPDGLEVRYNLSPLLADAASDSDGDGETNAREVALNTPIQDTNTTLIKSTAFEYKVSVSTFGTGLCSDLSQAKEVIVRNIPVISLSNGNLVEISALENNGSGVNKLRYMRFVVAKSIDPGLRVVADDFSNKTMSPTTNDLVTEVDK